MPASAPDAFGLDLDLDAVPPAWRTAAATAAAYGLLLAAGVAVLFVVPTVLVWLF